LISLIDYFNTIQIKCLSSLEKSARSSSVRQRPSKKR